MSKRDAETAKPETTTTTSEPSPSKKAKSATTTTPTTTMNIAHALGKPFRGKSFHELAEGPIHALHGIAAWEDAVAEKLKIKTVKDLGTWKFFHWARALARLAAEEVADQKKGAAPEAKAGESAEGGASAATTPPAAPGGAKGLNANKALDKVHAGKPLKDVLALPPSAFHGLPKAADELLGAFHIHTIADLGAWKHAELAAAIATMAKLEAEN